MPRWVPLVDVAQVPAERGMVVESLEGCFAVFLVGGVSHVLENTCPHRGGDIGEGYVGNGCVYCPLHAWPFDLQTGASPTHPGAAVRVFPSRIVNGKVEALLESVQLAEGAK